MVCDLDVLDAALQRIDDDRARQEPRSHPPRRRRGRHGRGVRPLGARLPRRRDPRQRCSRRWRCACGRTRCRSVDTATDSTDPVDGEHRARRVVAHPRVARAGDRRPPLPSPNGRGGRARGTPRIEFVSHRSAQSRCRDAHGVVLVDSLAAWSVAPWVLRDRQPRRPLAAILHQPPGGVGQGAAPHRGAAPGRPAALPPLRPADRREHRHSRTTSSTDTACPPSESASSNRAATCRSTRRRRGRPAQRTPDRPALRRQLAPQQGRARTARRRGRAPSSTSLTLHLVGRTDVDAGYTARLQAAPRRSRPRRAGRRPRPGHRDRRSPGCTPAPTRSSCRATPRRTAPCSPRRCAPGSRRSAGGRATCPT